MTRKNLHANLVNHLFISILLLSLAGLLGCSSSIGTENGSIQNTELLATSDLAVLNTEILQISGPMGGPFPAGSRVYVVENPRPFAATIFVIASADYLIVDAPSSIPPNSTATFEVSINQMVAAALPVGTYSSTIAVSEAGLPAGAEVALLDVELEVVDVSGGSSTIYPDSVDVAEVYAFNFLSPADNQIANGLSEDPFCSAFPLNGYGDQWNNLISRPFRFNNPIPPDPWGAIDTQQWTTSADGNCMDRTTPGLVNMQGAIDTDLSVTVEGRFGTFNTGGTDDSAPGNWEDLFLFPFEIASYALSHLFVDGRNWNQTDEDVDIRVAGLTPGFYVLVFWLNPTDHNPPRDSIVTVNGSSFLIENVAGGYYHNNHNVHVTDAIQVSSGEILFNFSAVVDPNNSNNNSDASLAAFAAIRMQ